MLGEPVAMEAERLGVAREIDRIRDSDARSAARRDRSEIEDAERYFDQRGGGGGGAMSFRFRPPGY